MKTLTCISHQRFACEKFGLTSNLRAAWLTALIACMFLPLPAHAAGRTENNSAEATLDSNLFPQPAPTEGEFPALHNLIQITDRIFSGGEPANPQAFAELKALGIRTVVSVDGARPDVEEARNHGMRYVHIPIGYDGVSSNAALSLTRVMRDADGPIYFHCHHGRHRGPAAAAVACIASGDATPQSALTILRRAGTSTNYAGLWSDVAAFTAPTPQTALPELVEVAQVDSIVEAMAAIDRAYDNLKLCEKAGWQAPPGHPDIVPRQEALLLKQAFRETGRMQGSELEARLIQWLRESEVLAGQLEASLAARQYAKSTQTLQNLHQACQTCHKAYRN